MAKYGTLCRGRVLRSALFAAVVLCLGTASAVPGKHPGHTSDPPPTLWRLSDREEAVIRLSLAANGEFAPLVVDAATLETARSNPMGWRAANGMFEGRADWVDGGRAPLDENYAYPVYSEGMALRFERELHIASTVYYPTGNRVSNGVFTNDRQFHAGTVVDFRGECDVYVLPVDGSAAHWYQLDALASRPLLNWAADNRAVRIEGEEADRLEAIEAAQRKKLKSERSKLAWQNARAPLESERTEDEPPTDEPPSDEQPPRKHRAPAAGAARGSSGARGLPPLSFDDFRALYANYRAGFDGETREHGEAGGGSKGKEAVTETRKDTTKEIRKTSGPSLSGVASGKRKAAGGGSSPRHKMSSSSGSKFSKRAVPSFSTSSHDGDFYERSLDHFADFPESRHRDSVVDEEGGAENTDEEEDARFAEDQARRWAAASSSHARGALGEGGFGSGRVGGGAGFGGSGGFGGGWGGGGGGGGGGSKKKNDTVVAKRKRGRGLSIVYPKDVITVTQKKAYNEQQEKERSANYGINMSGKSDPTRTKRSVDRSQRIIVNSSPEPESDSENKNASVEQEETQVADTTVVDPPVAATAAPDTSDPPAAQAQEPEVAPASSEQPDVAAQDKSDNEESDEESDEDSKKGPKKGSKKGPKKGPKKGSKKGSKKDSDAESDKHSSDESIELGEPPVPAAAPAAVRARRSGAGGVGGSSRVATVSSAVEPCDETSASRTRTGGAAGREAGRGAGRGARTRGRGRGGSH